MAFYEYHRSNPAVLKTVVGSSVDFSFPLHFHTSFELLYVGEGEIEVVVDKTTYHPQRGMLMLIPPDSAHSYFTREHSKIGLLIFNANVLPEICEEMRTGIYRDPVIADGEAIFHELKAAEGNVLLFRAALYRIAAAYAENPPLAAVPKGGDDFVPTFSAYMEKHCAEPLTEGTVAKALGYHPRYLSTLIRKGFGTSFCRVLNDYRVKEACVLLREGKRSVTEVYLTVGFESQSSFNRNFKAVMGVTPLAYRRGYRIGRGGHAEGDALGGAF